MARSRPIDSTGQRGFKVLVLDEVDRLSKDAQHSLRRTMEKYSAACRLVLCCNNVSKVANSAVSTRRRQLSKTRIDSSSGGIHSGVHGCCR